MDNGALPRTPLPAAHLFGPAHPKICNGIELALTKPERLPVPYLLVFEFARVFNRLKPLAGRTRGTSDRLKLF
jgi:hypothetical protein